MTPGGRWSSTRPGAALRSGAPRLTPGYVLSEGITYSFEDERDPLVIAAGDGFVLPPAPRHRGRNDGDRPAQLFLIDALPGA
jgi:hypothetical protein